jgi:hypothetical protein
LQPFLLRRMKVDVLGAYSTYKFFRFVRIGVTGRDGYPVCTRCGMRVQAVAPMITRTALSWIGYLLLYLLLPSFLLCLHPHLDPPSLSFVLSLTAVTSY